MDDGSNSLANKCILYRIENGIVRKELAQFIGISVITIDRVENNTLNVSHETIEKMEKLLKFKGDYFVLFKNFS